MDNVFEKIKGTDNKETDKDNSFINLALKDLQNRSDILKSLFPNKQKKSFGSNKDKFKEECALLIKYIKK